MAKSGYKRPKPVLIPVDSDEFREARRKFYARGVLVAAIEGRIQDAHDLAKECSILDLVEAKKEFTK
jgi:hypothetical protein